MVYSRPPQALLGTYVHDIHRDAVLEKLRGHDYPVTSWEPDILDTAMQALYDATASSDDLPVPMWDTVDLDGGWHYEANTAEKPVYPVSILGSSGISLARLDNLAYANIPSGQLELQSHIDEVDTPIRALNVVLHTNARTGRQAFNVHEALKHHTAYVFLGQDMPPLAVRRNTLLTASKEFSVNPFSTRTIDEAQSQSPEGSAEFLNADTCTALILALERSKKELRMADD